MARPQDDCGPSCADAAGCCIGCILVTTILVAITVGFVIFCDWSITPSTPEFHLDSVTTTQPPFTVINSTLNTGQFNLNLWIGNSNSGEIYDSANISVYYHVGHNDHYLSSNTTITSLCGGQGCFENDEQTRLHVAVPAASVPSSDEIDLAARKDAEAGLMSLTIKVAADFREYIERGSSTKLRVTCKNVKVMVPSGNIVGGPKHCKVYWSANIFDRWFGHAS